MSVVGRDIFTVGHSTYGCETFLDLLERHSVSVRIDVWKETA